MRLRTVTISALILSAVAPFAAWAQGHGHDGVPPGHMPPAGTCRIWFDGRPPGHQPLPTDCRTAFEDAPPDARVIVGAGVDASDYDPGKHDHGEHRGWDKGHGNKHGDHGDHDENADQPPPVPSVLPDMVGASFASEGRTWPEALRWLGGARLMVHVDATLGGRPTRVRWTDANGVVVQEWIDTNGDGRADIVHVYHQGVLVHTYHQ